jgi:capsular exopolysaccharide synthesis family protein
MELQEYIEIVKRYLNIILMTSFIGGIGGGLLTFVIPSSEPAYTSTTQGVLLTSQGTQTLNKLLKRAGRFTATTSVLVRIQSPDITVTDEEYTKSRIAFYTQILLSKASLSSVAENTGVAFNDLRDHIELSTLGDSTLIQIQASNPDGGVATQLSESVAAGLAQRIEAIETLGGEVEILGTKISEPTNLLPSTVARDLILSDPLNVSQMSAEAIALFGDDEYELVSRGLPLPRTSDQIKAVLSLTSGLPNTSEQMEPINPEQLGTITIAATDPDAETADGIVLKAAALLQEKIAMESSLPESTMSPLVLTRETLAADNLEFGTDPSQNGSLGVNFILGLLIGAGVGLGYAFFRASQDTTIRNAHQLVERTGELPIGIISVSDIPESTPRMAMLHETSIAAESYRALRANLMFGLPDVKVICLTSTNNKSIGTTGINLAVALSQAGQSVILVEANLQMPELSETMQLTGQLGLDSVLNKTCNSQDAIELWNPGGISVLSTKGAGSGSSEMLSTKIFTELIDELRSLYSYVIVTTPSPLNSTDAAIVAHRCDATLLLTECARSTVDQLEIAATSLLQVGAPIAGVVVTEVPASEINSWRATQINNPQATT